MEKRQIHFQSDLKIRNSGNENEGIIEGYFVRYNSETNLWGNFYEEIAQGALDESLRNKNILCLDNHDTRIVLGSTATRTLELHSDEIGLFGKVTLDLEDPEAKSAYRKVQTGKVRGCSFGFYVEEEETTYDDNKTKWIIKKADLIEVSITAFPAYPQTDISARQADYESIKKELFNKRKKELKERLING